MKCLDCGYDFPDFLIAKQPPYCYACCYGGNRAFRRRQKGIFRRKVEAARRIQLRHERKARPPVVVYSTGGEKVWPR